MTDKELRSYRLSPRAREDLADIWQHSASTWSSKQADTYIRNLAKTFDALVAHPKISKAHVEFEPPVRLRRYRSHLVIYRIEGSYLLIVRVLHIRRNWQSTIAEMDP